MVLKLPSCGLQADCYLCSRPFRSDFAPGHGSGGAALELGTGSLGPIDASAGTSFMTLREPLSLGLKFFLDYFLSVLPVRRGVDIPPCLVIALGLWHFSHFVTRL